MEPGIPRESAEVSERTKGKVLEKSVYSGSLHRPSPSPAERSARKSLQKLRRLSQYAVHTTTHARALHGVPLKKGTIEIPRRTLLYLKNKGCN